MQEPPAEGGNPPRPAETIREETVAGGNNTQEEPQKEGTIKPVSISQTGGEFFRMTEE